MSKSILVIDTPESCMQCPLLGGFPSKSIQKADGTAVIQEWYYFCFGGITRRIYDVNEVNKNCLLKEMPSKVPQIFQEKNCFSDKDKALFQGWNDCLKEILGERE